MKDKNEITAKRLIVALAGAGIRQQDLANRSGVSKASISQYVNAKYAPSYSAAERMGGVLNVSTAWLMGFSVKKERSETIDLSMLNSEGKQKVIDYIADLAENPKYRKDNS